PKVEPARRPHDEDESDDDEGRGKDGWARALRYTLDLAGPLGPVLVAADGPAEATFTYGLGRIAGFVGREARYYGTDLRGSVRSVTDQRGRLRALRSYDPWGEPDAAGSAGQERGPGGLTWILG